MRTAIWCFVCAAALLGLCQGAIASTQAEIFVDRVMALLPPGEALDMLRDQERSGNLNPEAYYPFGKGMCDGLRRGRDPKRMLEEGYYQFWGKPLSDAMYQAARETICPDLRP